MHSYVIDRREDLLKFVSDFTDQTGWGVSMDWILANFRPQPPANRWQLAYDLRELRWQGSVRSDRQAGITYYWPAEGVLS